MPPPTMLALGLALAGCSPTIERSAPSPDRMAFAEIPGIPRARFWTDEAPPNLVEQLAEVREERRASGLDEDFDMLALSGGADDGAFGAGLLAAWTERGDRPEFDLVTGVSTGALSAPFAFLGPEYDDDLREVYGGFPPERIFAMRSLLQILPNASAADSAPLAELIAQFATEEFLAEIAREHRRGRRLLVQSTNLDAQRGVLWDLGAIAASGAPNAPQVFRDALLASASVPGAFPPVLIDVEVDGEIFDEMHVDGGVLSESTVLADWQVDLKNTGDLADARTARLWVVRNGRIAPEPKQVDYDLLSIGGRAASTMIKAQGIADLLTAAETAQLRGFDLYLTWIGEDFQVPYPGPFDPDYMRALFDYGYDLMKSGDPWVTRPPQRMTSEERRAALRYRE